MRPSIALRGPANFANSSNNSSRRSLGLTTALPDDAVEDIASSSRPGPMSRPPNRTGRCSSIPLHQLYPLLAHVALFGAGYAAATVRAARAVLNLS
jgi:hypothetical protein